MYMYIYVQCQTHMMKLSKTGIWPRNSLPCKLLMQQCLYNSNRNLFYILHACAYSHTIYVCDTAFMSLLALTNPVQTFFSPHELIVCCSNCWPYLVAVQQDSVELAWNLFLLDTAEIYLLWIYSSWINVSPSEYHLWTKQLILI